MTADKRLNVADVLARAIKKSGKKQMDIAKAAGFKKPNMVSMLTGNRSRIPYGRVVAIAEAVDLNPAGLLGMAIMEYSPELWAALRKVYVLQPRPEYAPTTKK